MLQHKYSIYKKIYVPSLVNISIINISCIIKQESRLEHKKQPNKKKL